MLLERPRALVIAVTITLVLGVLVVSEPAEGAHVGADMVLNGSDFSAVSDQWTIEPTAIWSNVSDEWVEYEADLTAGLWQVGIEATNEGDLSPDPWWYPQYELTVSLSSLSTENLYVQASDSEVHHGFMEYYVPADGTYTARFTWLNDQAENPLPGGGFEWDANIRIERVFFDEVLDVAPGQWFANPANGHAYALTQGWATFEEAEAQAVAWGGHLVTINDQAEQDWLYETFSSWGWLIGLNDIDAEGTFVWVSGEPVSFTNWCLGEPNDYMGEDSVSMTGGAQCWNDEPGGGTGIVEVENPPDPHFNVAYDSYPGGRDDFIHLYEWLPGSRLTIAIDDPGTGPGVDYQVDDIAVASTDGFNVDIGPEFDIQTGHEVTVTDGSTSMTHVVTNLRITEANPESDVVSGIGEVGKSIYVGSHEDPLGDYWVDPAADGSWSVDMSGDDLRPGYGLISHQYDEQGNNTQFDYQVPQRHFKVHHGDDFVVFVGWVPGSTLNVSFDDPATGMGVDYEITDLDVLHDGVFDVEFGTEFDVEPGHAVTVDDGVNSLTHIVRNLVIMSADPVTDVVSGTAAPGEEVVVLPWSEGEPLTDVRVDPAPDGSWTADLSAQDLQPGYQIEASQYEDLAAGSAGTGFFYWVPEELLHPTLTVFMNDDFSTSQGINGFDFLPGSDVTLTVDLGDDGSIDYEDIATVDGGGGVSFNARIPTVQEGDVVTLTDDLDPPRIKTHVVGYFTLTEVDPAADIVSGTGRAGTELYVRAIDPTLPFPEGSDVIVLIDGTEEWTADFSGIYDITPGTSGWVQTDDADGDHTQIGWWVPLPDPWSWVYNSATGHYYAATDWDLSFSDAETAAQGWDGHLVTIDSQAEDDWLYEAFGPNPFWIGMNDIASEGTWVWTSGDPVTYTNWCPGEPNESPPGEDAAQLTGGGERCWNDVPTTNNYSGIVEVESLQSVAHIEQNFTNGHLSGNGWPGGAVVTITVDDPDTPQPDDYVTQATVQQEGPGETAFQVNLWDEFGAEFDLRAGLLITVTDGITAKLLEVADLSVTDIDAAADTITGTAEPEVALEVGVVAPNGYTYSAILDVTADGAGVWTADFGGIYDLAAGDPFVVRQADLDGDVTFLNLSVPPPEPLIEALVTLDALGGKHWPAGATVTITMDDPDTPESVDHETEAIVTQYGPSPLDTEFHVDLQIAFEGQYQMLAGQIFTVTDGTTTKVLEVAELTVSDADAISDTVTGTADPGTELYVFVSMPDAPTVAVAADAAGNWTADFSGTYDLGPGMAGGVQQFDADGDMTEVMWEVPNPQLAANPWLDYIMAWDWPLGTSVTLTVDNDFDVGNGVLHEATATVEQFEDTFYTRALFDLIGVFNLQASHVITVSDGTVTKTHQVTSVDLTEIDLEADTMSGVADPFAVVNVEAWTDNNGAGRRATADAAGDWIVDFSYQPTEDDYDGGNWGSVDLQGNYDFGFYEQDDELDNTGWERPQGAPGMLAVPGLDVINIDATGLSPVAVTIESDSGELLYETTLDVVRGGQAGDLGGFNFPDHYPFINSPIGYPGARIELDGVLDLVSGQVITWSDIAYTVELVVSDLSVTEVDVDADVAFGTYGSPATGVWGALQDFAAYGFTEPVGGDWTMSFCEAAAQLADGTCVPWDIVHDDLGLVLAYDGSEFRNYTGTVWNLLPNITEVTLPTDPVHTGTPVDLSASFVDLEVPDSHIATVDWGDGSDVETVDVTPGSGPGSGGTIAATHSYADAGSHPVTLTVIDAAGDSDAAIGAAPVNDPPVAVDDGGVCFPVGSDADTVLYDSFDAGTAGSERGGVVYGPGMFGFGDTVNLETGSWIKYTPRITGFEAAGTIEAWVRPHGQPTSIVHLNWYDSETSFGGYIGYFDIVADGRFRYSAWSSSGSGGEIVSTNPVPTGPWVHLAATWGPDGTRLYVNGELDAELPNRIAPSLSGGAYVYLNAWGESPGAVIDELRISDVARTDFAVRTACTGYMTDEDTTLDVAAPGVLSNDTDPDGDSLTATAATDPANGTVTLSSDGGFTYSPDLGFVGSDTFTYDATDGTFADTATVIITINPINEPPAAVDDAYSTDEDTTLEVAAPGVLGNDVDPDGDPLTVSVVDDAHYGTLTLAVDGSFDYDPDPDFNGTDSFTYSVAGAYLSDTATVTITVNPINDALVAVDDGGVCFPVGSDADTVLYDSFDAGTAGSERGGVVYGPGMFGFGDTVNLETGSWIKYTPRITGFEAAGTIEAWVRPHGQPTSIVHLNWYDSETSFGGYIGYFDIVADGRFRYSAWSSSGSGGEIVSTNPVPTGPWVHLAATWGPDGTRLYVNGELDAELPNRIAPSLSGGAYVYLNAWGESPGAVIDELRISDVARTDFAVRTACTGYMTDEDTTLDVAAPGVLSNDTDPDGDSLTATAATDPANGTVTLSSDGGFTYSPDLGFVGSDTFTYDATDGTFADTATVIITINPINEPPAAVDDAYSTDEDTTLEVAAPGVLGNDVDPDGDPLTVSVVDDAHYGTLTLAVDGSFDYDPDPDFNGTDSFTYSVAGAYLSDTATVTITVNPINDALVAVDDGGVCFPVGSDADTVLYDSFDAGTAGSERGGVVYGPGMFGFGDTVNLETGSWIKYTPRITGFEAAGTIEAWVRPHGQPTSIVHLNWYDSETSFGGYIGYFDIVADGRFRYSAWSSSGSGGEIVSTNPVPTGPWVHLAATWGPDGTRLYVNGELDAELPNRIAPSLSGGAYVYLNAWGESPGAVIDELRISDVARTDFAVRTACTGYMTDEDTTLDVAAPGVLSNDTDPDGDSLTATAATDPANGTVTLSSDGGFTYSPDLGFVGSDTFTYDATDGTFADTATVIITINPINEPPAAVDDAYSTDEDTTLEVAAPGVLGNDVDPDGDPLTVSVVDDAHYGTLTLAVDGSFDYDPDPDFNGTDSFTYSVAGAYLSDTATVTITVNPINDALVAVDDGGVCFPVGSDADTVLYDSFDAGTAGSERGGVVYGPGMFGFGDTVNLETGSWIKYTPRITGFEAAGTIEAWVRPHGQPTSIVHLNWYDSETSFGGYIGYFDIVADGRFRYSAWSSSGSGGEIVSTNPVPTGPWVHLAATWGPDGTRLYVNGELDAELPNRIAPSLSGGAYVYLNAWGESPGAVIDELRISDVARTDFAVRTACTGYMTDEDTTLDVAAPGVLSNDTDPDGDSLTATAATDPANGTVTLSSDGGFTYSPDLGFVGSDTFTYDATDGTFADTATVIITINPINEPPAAVDDAYSTDEDTTLEVAAPGVLGNDVDPDGDPLTVSVVDDAHYGTLTLAVDGSFDYDPDPDFNGTDSFTYSVAGAYLSDTATVTITVNPINDALVAVDDGGVCFPVGSDADTVLYDSFDAGTAGSERGGVVYGPGMFGFGDTVNLETGSWIKYTPRITGFEAAGTIEAWVRPHGQPTSIVHLNWYDSETSFGGYIGYFDIVADGRFRYSAWSSSGSGGEIVSTNPVPTGPWVHLAATWGPDGTRLYVNGELDAELPNRIAPSLSGGAYVYLNAWGESPGAVIDELRISDVARTDFAVRTACTGYMTDEDTTLDVAAPGVLSNDTDPDGDSLTATAATDPANGTVTLSSDGGFTYSPDLGFVGSDTFTYDATDGTFADTATVIITINPINEPPAAVDDAYSTDEDTTLEVAAPGVLGNDVDPDGDPLTVSVVDDAHYGTLTLAVDGSFDYDPDPDFNGTDSFTYSASDSAVAAEATVTIVVGPVNDAPVARDDSYEVAEGGVLEVAPGYVVELAWGSAGSGPGEFVLPFAVAIDGAGFVYVADYTADRIQKFTSEGDLVVEWGGSGSGPGEFNEPTDIEIGPSGTIYVADKDNRRIQLFTSDGTYLDEIDTDWFHPGSVAVDEAGFVYAIGSPYPEILKFTPSGEPVPYPDGYWSINQSPRDVWCPDGCGIDVDSEGHLWVAIGGDAGDGDGVVIEMTTEFEAIREWDALHPSFIAVDDSGYVYTLSAYEPPMIRKHTPAGHVLAEWSVGAEWDRALGLALSPSGSVATTQRSSTSTEVWFFADQSLLGNDRDVDYDVLTTTLLTDVTYGELTLDSDGSFSYSHDGSETTTDSFTYEACDPDGLCDTATATIYVDDADGVDRPIEDGAPNQGDGNADGIPDSDQQNVASLPNAVDGQYVTVESPPNTQLTEVETIVPPEDPPDTVEVPNGLTGYTVEGLDPGGAVTVTQYLPLNSEIDDYWKYGPTTSDPTDHWYRFIFDGTTGAEITHEADRTVIVLRYIDGQRGDSDLVADGRVVDPGGPAIILNQPTVAHDDAFATDEDTPLTVDAPGVLGNDVDEDGDPLATILMTGPAHGTLALNADGSFAYTPDADWFGDDTFTYVANDGMFDSNEATVTIEVTSVNDPPVGTASPAEQNVQHSDSIASVSIAVDDIDSASVTATAIGLPAGVTLAGSTCTVPCGLTLSGSVTDAAGTYNATIVLDDGTNTTDVDVTVVVEPEDASIVFHGGNPVAVQVATPGGTSGTFELMVRVNETEPDAAVAAPLPGDLARADVAMQLIPVGPGGTADPVGECERRLDGDGYDRQLTVTCAYDFVPVNSYMVEVTVDGGFYEGVAEDVVVVYDPSLGYTTGGGSFLWPGTDEVVNFGYTMEYNKKGKKVKGNLLLIRHLADGSTYQVKSNALYGLALGEGDDFGWASFSGKATYLDPTMPEPEGNHDFIVYVEDRNEPGDGIDRFWIEMHDKADAIIPALSMIREATDQATPLEGGNLVVPHGAG